MSAITRMMILALAMSLSLGAAACDSDTGPGGPADGDVAGQQGAGGTPAADQGAQPSASTSAAWCPSGTFVGDLQGAEGTITATFSSSIHFDSDSYSFDGQYIQMGGELKSASAWYLFAADLYPYSGYGDMTDVIYNETFKIYVELTADGLYIVTNPYEGLYSTTYQFTCVP